MSDIKIKNFFRKENGEYLIDPMIKYEPIYDLLNDYKDKKECVTLNDELKN